jgi:antitoxin HigA-1
MKRKMKPVHPGAILREDILKEMELSITKAAEGLEISRKQLSEVINENAAISAEMAVRLEQGFGVSAEFWLDLQKKHDIWKVQTSGRVHIHRIRQSRLTAIVE